MFPRSMSARSEILESPFVMRHRETKTNVKADFRLIKNNYPYEINYNFLKKKMRGRFFMNRKL